MNENITPIPAEEAPAAEPAEIPAPPKKLGMKWHHFLCFILPFSGIMGTISALILLIFMIADGFSSLQFLLEQTTMVYVVCEVLKFLTLLVTCILMILAWVGLHKFRRGSPRFYMAVLAFYTVTISLLTAVYEISINTSAGWVLVSVLPGLAIQGIYIWLNSIYFRKRAHLYVN